MAKRCFDLAVSAIALLVLSPVLLLVALLIRLDSPGPAIFRQVRVARGGVPFEMLKFRTMKVVPAGTGPLITVAGDTRITRFGRALRQSKLDELPQLINVLRGDMSLVGPRPEVPKYVALYPPELREIVLSVRPGITDEASMEFSDESALLAQAQDAETAYVEQIMPRKLALYAQYARQRTFFGDLRIVLKTLRLVARR
jgi:lipopolysaccharide/colanic/teichoic acid biosynthesis glycosyltransferase